MTCCKQCSALQLPHPHRIVQLWLDIAVHFSLFSSRMMMNFTSGRNVPSVSIYAALPSAPPIAFGNWVVTHLLAMSPTSTKHGESSTHIVWANCVLPHRNSPKTSVRDMVMIPPPSMVSKALLPVEMQQTFFLYCEISTALWNVDEGLVISQCLQCSRRTDN